MRREKSSKAATATRAELGARRRIELVQEFSRKLDEAGVVPCSLESLFDVGVGLFLVIRDHPSGELRLFEIAETDAKYCLLLDTIIKQHAGQTRMKAQAARWHT